MELGPDALARVPIATYRLELGPGFGFAEARALVPYLAALGVSDCSLSPFFVAAADRSHGYDVVDHGRLNPALGTEEDHAALSGALAAAGMGQMIDLVPNRMGIAGSRSAWWMDVLENGPASPFASHLDIDWEPARSELRHKVVLPLLGDQYGRVLERGELALELQDGAFFVRYRDLRLPLAPRTYRDVLGHRLEALEGAVGLDDAHRAELLSILTALGHLPPGTETDPARLVERTHEREVIKRRLAALLRASPQVRAHVEDSVREFNGVVERPESFDLLDRLLDAQAYRLAFWQTAAGEASDRRFVDINELAAIRMEEPAVFERAHRLVRRLVRAGRVTGIRVDHIDGLSMPGRYLADLQALCLVERATGLGVLAPGATEGERAALGRAVEAAAGGAPARPFHVIAEKILGPGETLPEGWPVHGTTGYDFLAAVGGLLVDPAGERSLTQTYARFTRNGGRYADVVYESRKLAMDTAMSSEIAVLAHRLARISEHDRVSRDFTDRSLAIALREIIACFPVYRTYAAEADGEVGERDRRYIEVAVARARRRNPTLSRSIFDFIRDLLCLAFPPSRSQADRAERLAFVRKFEQVTGPIAARGVAGTASYRYHRLVSLNEVGGSPDRFGVPVEEFHRLNAERLARWPGSLSTTSTHDTKRGEDVRARIGVLSQLPGEWRTRVRRWSRLNRRWKTDVGGQPVPDANAEYLLYQALLGAWPLGEPSPAEWAAFAERIQGHMRKALREARAHVSWVDPREDYDAAVERFVGAMLDRSRAGAFLDDFVPFQRRIARWGMLDALAQTLLKLASPGVPDLYQGTELWELSLADPDNRRPVDYAHRQALLDRLTRELDGAGADRPARVRALVNGWEDGRVKLHVVHATLTCRREHPALFREGEYLPLAAVGARRDHVAGFARRRGDEAVLAIVPRLLARLDGAQAPPDLAAWEDTAIVVPEGLGDGPLRHRLTGEVLGVERRDGQAVLEARRLFACFPVALLEPAASRTAVATAALEGHARTALPRTLPAERWFAAKDRRLTGATIRDAGALAEDLWLTLVEVAFERGAPEVYCLPLRLPPSAAGEIRDALDDPAAALALVRLIAGERTLATRGGTVRGTRTATLREVDVAGLGSSRRLGAEQSNTSILVDEAMVLKLYRRVVPGVSPEVEVLRFLGARTDFRGAPALLGAIHHEAATGQPATLAVLQRFVPNRGDGWTWLLGELAPVLASLEATSPGADSLPLEEAVRERAASLLAGVHRLGTVTGRLHTALASDPVAPGFVPEPITGAHVERWRSAVEQERLNTEAVVRASVATLPPALARESRDRLARADVVANLTAALGALGEDGCHAIRVHGDYHLGQVLRTDDDFVIFDFEGEPARSLAQRRARACALRDVAGMLRSFDYAAATVVALRPDSADRLRPAAEAWRRLAIETYLEGYLPAAALAPARLIPIAADAVRRVLGALELEKALYEIRYEASHRPEWLPIPLRGVCRILADAAGRDAGGS